MNIFGKISILLYISMFLSSCDVYTTEEIIQEGQETIIKNRPGLEAIILLTEKLSIDSSMLYEITTSSTTDGYSFKCYNLDTLSAFYTYNKNVDINTDDIKLIWNSIPKKQITDFVFLKNEFVIFSYDQMRDEQYNYSSLIYFKSNSAKEKFIQKFQLSVINQKNNINGNWIYFYGNEWAISNHVNIFK